MNDGWLKVEGIVVEGHQVASRGSDHYPSGTIELQLPFFRQRGLDLSDYHRGTLNLSIAPATMTPLSPEFTFRAVRWTDAHPPEDFSFSRCRLKYHDRIYQGLIYYPHPETKERHFQNPSIVEVIAPLIGGIGYGERVELEVNPNEISINDGNDE